jgi:hypothetical protein
MDRRQFITRSAVAGGMVWAAPVMTSFASRAFAGTPERTDLCPTEAQPSGLRWRYTGLGCAGSDNSQVLGGQNFCEDFGDYPSTPSNGFLTVRITGGPDRGTYENVVANLQPGATFLSPPNGGRAGANTVFTIRDAAGNLLHRVGFHTSCSQPLFIGDRFGSFELIEGVPRNPA